MVQVIAHELQHACEVAKAPDARVEMPWGLYSAESACAPAASFPSTKRYLGNASKALVGQELPVHSMSRKHQPR